MIILALNCGSSSVKYKLYRWGKKQTLTQGEIERIGIGGCPDHRTALKQIIDALTQGDQAVIKDLAEISAVGHRVVHGGEKFKSSILINDEVLEAIRSVQDLAPLHNPPNILGIEAAKEFMPQVPQIAVFDTAFHQTMPEPAFLYAVPYEWYGIYGVRRYGFHGTSHLYVSRRAAVLLGKSPAEVNLITMHIGNGVSVTAVKEGIS
ncbi:MAG: propionate kinase, partial [Candidatus Margulisbacteria bacterium]|nr:propionate kinase [Candidatus Margulisiibacteriota bacterium]